MSDALMAEFQRTIDQQARRIGEQTARIGDLLAELTEARAATNANAKTAGELARENRSLREALATIDKVLDCSDTWRAIPGAQQIAQRALGRLT